MQKELQKRRAVERREKIHKLVRQEVVTHEESLPKQPRKSRMLMKLVVRIVDRSTQVLSQTAGLGATRVKHGGIIGVQAFSQCYLRRMNGFANTVSHTNRSSLNQYITHHSIIISLTY